MKLNAPITPEDHARADAEHQHRVEEQKRLIGKIVELIERGEPLDRLQRGFICGFIKEAVPLVMKPKRRRSAGHPSSIPDEARILFAALVIHKGLSERAAMQKIAEKYGVSRAAVQRKMGRAGTPEERVLALAEMEVVYLLVT
ncbi:hypothetical protein [Pseudomonas sp. 18173]|uniref:hypothetical protein n=1 Tax=Pseudomonas sp. 18173 TaxID=3390055 RepID=UPI003D1DDCF0